jgi:hypothetical protein
MQKVLKWLMNPPPSNFVFYLLIASNLWFSFQVEMQGKIIKAQMILIDFYVSQIFKR